MRKFIFLFGTIVLVMAMMVGCDTEQNDSSESSDSSGPSTPPPIHYTITFDKNGGTGGTMTDLSADGGQEITLPACAFTAPTGKKFGTWNTAAAGSGTDYAVGAKVKDLTTTNGAVVMLYAKWIEKDAHSISYLNTKDADNSLNPTSFLESATISINNISVDGYTFGGWYDSSTDFSNDHHVTSWAAGAKTADVTLWAKWTVNTYTIKFDKNGGSGTDIADLPMTYDKAKNLTANGFTRTGGYSFLGWSTVSDAATATYQDKESVSNLTTTDGAEVTLYAVWFKNKLADNGNIVIKNIEYSNTSFTKVIDTQVTVTGSDDNWSGYLDSSVSAGYKGAFIKNRNVKLSPYSMSKYLVTQELYEAVMSSGRNYGKNSTEEGKHPAYYVSWYDAITFCNKLSILMGKNPCYSVKKNGNEIDWENYAYATIPESSNSDWNAATCDITKNGYRLPTEAEWEFAARGGDPSQADWYYAFSGVQSLKQIYRGTTESDTDYGGTSKYLQKDDNLASVGWYIKNSSSNVHTVGGKTANRLGIYDMSGNLYEWCWDWYGDITTGTDDNPLTVENPQGAASGSSRVQRGGRWSYDARSCCVSYRIGNNPYGRYTDYGFRLACKGE